MVDFLFDGPETARATLLLAHGAGAAMDSGSMNAMTAALAAEGIRVVRFEFSYMASRRTPAGPKPPPKAEKVMPEFLAAVAALGPVAGPLLIGGKSMGGRVASMVVDGLHAKGEVAGLVCLGYPFHPPGKPEQLRTAHLVGMTTPTLIVQGTRDPFGTREEVPGYGLSDTIDLLWMEDGDHDLKPRKAISGFTAAQHLKTMAEAVAAFAARIAP
jgi:uncharacterized protein